MQREKSKRAIAYGLMILSVLIFFFGEFTINSNPLIVHKYLLARIIASGVVWLAGYVYLDILEGRIERFKRR